jgi:branched-chain amino acid transport system permease protein
MRRVTIGVSISFGILDIVNIAHPAFIILGSYIAYIVNQTFGLDPILTCILVLPAFYALGGAVYQVYHYSFERHGQGRAARPRLLLRSFVRHRGDADPGVRRRTTATCRRRTSTRRCGSASSICRCACWCPACFSLMMFGGLALYLSRTFTAAPSWRLSQDCFALS